jgi:hypothetical protein
MARKVKVEEEKQFPRTFVAKNGEKIQAGNETQAEAFANAGLEEEQEQE